MTNLSGIQIGIKNSENTKINMLEQDITQKRKDRHHITQEDFTPPEVIEMLFKDIPQDLYTDFSKTFCDPCAGIGNILVYVLNRRLEYCKSEDDILNALSTLYGVELMEDNLEELQYTLLTAILINSKYNSDTFISKIWEILKRNFVCSDAIDWDFENWCSNKLRANKLF